MLNSYEAACFQRRWLPTHRRASLDGRPLVALDDTVAVFLVPVGQHMRRRSPWHKASHFPGQPQQARLGVREGISFHREWWVMVLLSEATSTPAHSGRHWLWPVKRQSELESDTGGRGCVGAGGAGRGRGARRGGGGG
jgi:hypothetical protein